MHKAGGIIGIIAGIFGIIAAVATLFFGGIGSAFEAEGAKTVVGLGWGGVAFSFLSIILGAVAFARPKAAGIGLIIVSILGAILGGTLVAVCMALSLIGGILALIGAKNEAQTTHQHSISDSPPPPQTKKYTWIWWTAGAVVSIIVLSMVGSNDAQLPKVDPIVDLAGQQPSDLHPDGELSDIFALGSKNTELQRENKLKEIKGKVIQWELPVYEVSRSHDGYKVQTKSSIRIGQYGKNAVGVFIYITPRNDDEKHKIESLKTDDIIKFKGRIAGTSMRSLEIKPAILSNNSTATINKIEPASTADINTDKEFPIVGEKNQLSDQSQPAETVSTATGTPAPTTPAAPALHSNDPLPGECSEIQSCIEQSLKAARDNNIDIVRHIASRIDSLPKPELGNKVQSRKLNAQGLETFKAGDYNNAAAYFQMALKENPRDAELEANLGSALTEAGRAGEAVTPFLSSLQLDPRRSWTWAPLAEAYVVTGQQDKAGRFQIPSATVVDSHIASSFWQLCRNSA
ncbi:tetratricopeptide repeat protein [Candidatus Methylospira mobilis]|uniref:tetratricopeptide repeat protein n=1 Tax=Candidatus Methylospira mobilis TaxID=1808979 RepID=UPI001D179AB3|nr:tetratricopeptide repeat protein [Candidatus Methylospira mobilis]